MNLDELRKKLVRKKQNSDRRTFLVVGDLGSGKSSLAATCKSPVLIHSFDPGGTKLPIIERGIDDGSIIVDDRFEEDAGTGKPFALWEKEIRAVRTIANELGTYVLDSLTTWQDSCLSYVIAKRLLNTKLSSSEEAMIKDYGIQIAKMRKHIYNICSLPCDVLVTGHLQIIKDETTGRLIAMPLVTGKFAERVGLAFDEIYIATVKSSKEESVYKLLVKKSGIYQQVRTRMGGDILEKYVEPDIKALKRFVALTRANENKKLKEIREKKNG